MNRQMVTGWGRTTVSFSDVIEPNPDEIVAVMQTSPSGGLIPRGMGRSYGDAASNDGGLVVSSRRMSGILSEDLGTGVIKVLAGTSIAALIERYVPRGWFPPVVPGTRFVSVGGAIAADIHGKNHHREGTFCNHISQLTLCTPSSVQSLTPQDDPRLFWATAGGMGLTGFISEATIQMKPVESAHVLVDTVRCPDLESLLARMVEGDDSYTYSVAWVDCLAKGNATGRGVLTRGEHMPGSATADRDPSMRKPRRVPLRIPPGRAGYASVRAFNEAYYRAAPQERSGERVTLERFFFPLDLLADWNRFYGRSGFVQFQCVVPDEATDLLRTILESFGSLARPGYLAVLKRFGDIENGPLSFPMRGWTLAVDVPASADGLSHLNGTLSEKIAEAGGRIYLAKDSMATPSMLSSMYPRLPEWRSVRAEVDPERVLRSDLGSRLQLV